MADASWVTGVVSAQEARINDAGLLAVGAGTSLDVRTGVMHGPGATTIVTGTAATGTMTVNVGPHHWVASRGTANGPYRGTKETSTTLTIGAAPGSNSRIDVVWAKMQDNTSGVPTPDGAVGEQYGVTAGTAAASPTKPAIPLGAVELATVQIAAGTTSTNGAGSTITNTAPLTVARGARIPVRSQTERDALTAYAGLEVYRLDSGRVETSNGAAWTVAFDPALPTANLPRGRVGSLTATTGGPSNVPGTETMFDPVTFTAVAGRRYSFTWSGPWIANTALVTAAFTVRTAAGASVTTAGTLQHGRLHRSPDFGEFIPATLITEVTGLAAGQTTIGVGIRTAVGAGTVSIAGASDNQRKIIVEDIGV